MDVEGLQVLVAPITRVTNGFVSHSFWICKCRVLGVSGGGLVLGGRWVTNGEHKTPRALPSHLTLPFVSVLGPQSRQSCPTTTIKTLTPNRALHQSHQTPKIYHSWVNFPLMMAEMKQNRTLTIGRGQILRQNSVRCFACFDTHCHHTIFGNLGKDDDQDHSADNTRKMMMKMLVKSCGSKTTVGGTAFQGNVIHPTCWGKIYQQETAWVEILKFEKFFWGRENNSFIFGAK